VPLAIIVRVTLPTLISLLDLLPILLGRLLGLGAGVVIYMAYGETVII